MPINCNSCSTYNDDDARFCRNCGKLLTDAGGNDVKVKKTSSKNNIAPVVVAVIATIVIIGATIALVIVTYDFGRIVSASIVVGAWYVIKAIWKDV